MTDRSETTPWLLDQEQWPEHPPVTDRSEKSLQPPDQILLGGKEFRRAFDRVWVGPLMPLSDELCLALTEIERLRRWQREARYVIDAWDDVYQLVPEWFRAERLGVIHADIVKAYLRTLLDGEA